MAFQNAVTITRGQIPNANGGITRSRGNHGPICRNTDGCDRASVPLQRSNQLLTVELNDPEMRNKSFGENVTKVTLSLCPFNVTTHTPVEASNIPRAGPLHPAIKLPRRENAAQVSVSAPPTRIDRTQASQVWSVPFNKLACVLD